MNFQKSLRYFLHRLFPFFLLYIVLQTFVRIALMIRDFSNVDFGIGIAKVFAIGFVFDVAAFTFIALPFILYLAFLAAHHHGKRADRIGTNIFFVILAFSMIFSAAAEWLFWDEFSTRFNFIAVDYLVYTQEVIGNIVESYPIGAYIAIVAVSSIALLWLFKPTKQFSKPAFHAPKFAKRSITMVIFLLVPALVFLSFNEKWAEVGQNRYQNELAKNGIYSLFAAFLNNELPYDQFYAQLDPKKSIAITRQEVKEPNATFLDDSTLMRHIVNPPINAKPNVMLVVVESLSASFMNKFGNDMNITPYLDKLADNSLFFSNLYANGTRTVYGLSAVSLSSPSVPGNSIIRRPENENLFTLATVLNARGYESKFIYGGFGYFDNMNYFFSHNGYGIVDRSNMSKEEITFANVWGVCDEDLFNKTIKESDASYAQGKPFFQTIMTTSNHRPYTFPDGKIDIPSRSGRPGAVKYTDYAIGKFIEDSRKKPWFDNTIFVIIADHTASSAGKSELDPDKYHIPLFIYAPKLVKPQVISKMASQIDLAPTLLALMGVSYNSQFYGHNALTTKEDRAFISNYQKLGYMEQNNLVVLKPIKKASFYVKKNGKFNKTDDQNQNMLEKAIGYYQSAADWKRLSHTKPQTASQHS